MFSKLKTWLVGKPKDPFSKSAWQSVALIAFFAWIGLGSDGLSSANYGPEEAFRALIHYPMLGAYLAIAIGLTVFIIAGSYNQVIELFPNGGGGYRVANHLLHPLAGLVSGSALIVDYILTIAISVAAAADALFSLLPSAWLHYSLVCKLALVLLLLILNLRGLKESIKILMPIFLGFVITHFVLIVYGIALHLDRVPLVIHGISQQTHEVVHLGGWLFFITLLLKAYSLGGGTFTGLEAVSNNVNVLAEPRVKTGKWTMFYMALSLSITAGGIILLYMLWNIQVVHGETFNAIVFKSILATLPAHHFLLLIVLLFEAGILLLGANTGFLGGPAVLANMASDRWVPSQFNNLSNRLVKQNGIVFFGIGALIILLITHGHVGALVVLYSVNVFLTFAITLFGLCKYWLTTGRQAKNWKRRFALSLLGFVVCSTILAIILIEKFLSGAWMTVIVTSLIITCCYLIRRYYRNLQKQLNKLSRTMTKKAPKQSDPIAINSDAPIAVIFVNDNTGVGLHTLLALNKLFPDRYKNYIFVQAGVVDVQSFNGKKQLTTMQKRVERNLNFFKNYAWSHGFGAESYCEFGTNALEDLFTLAEKIYQQHPKAVFFAGRAIYEKDNMLTRLLRNELPLSLQQKMHFLNMPMIILPMRLSI